MKQNPQNNQKRNLEKVKVEIIELGQLPFQINQKNLKCKSEFFEIKSISYESIPVSSSDKSHKIDKRSEYVEENDRIINRIIQNERDKYNKDNTIYFFISYIHMKNEWYCRKVNIKYKKHNAGYIVFSFADIYDKLITHNVPPENLLISTLFSYALYYSAYSKLPTEEDERKLMHRDTRGCIMDFCVNNIDAIFSAERPFLCNECVNNLSKKLIEKLGLTGVEVKAFPEKFKIKINKELSKIKKNWLISIKEFIQKHAFLSLFFSFIFPFTISVLSNINFSCPFSWEAYGLVLATIVTLIVWFIVLVIFIYWDKKKFKKFRSKNTQEPSVKSPQKKDEDTTPKT